MFQPRNPMHLKRCAMPSMIQHYNDNRKISTKTTSSDELDKPIPYSTSKAATWKAKYSRVPPSNSVTPTWQRHVILVSLLVFMLHFCVLREENDLDIMLAKNLNLYAGKSDNKLPKRPVIAS